MVEYYFCFFILGLAVGSFLNVCIYRIPKGESVISPPSHCTNCGKRLNFADLIPVVGYLLLKGRCRCCGAGISPMYPAVELLTGIMYMLLYKRYSLSVDFAAFAFLMSLLVVVFFIDLEHKIIPDGLVLTGIAGGILVMAYNMLQPLRIYGDRNWWNPLAGILAGSGILFLVALIGALVYKSDEAMGMGDVKIFAPIGIFLGWKMTLLALALAVFSAGGVSLLLLILGIKEKKSTIPFGPFIVIGTFISIMWGWDILKWYLASFAA